MLKHEIGFLIGSDLSADSVVRFLHDKNEEAYARNFKRLREPSEIIYDDQSVQEMDWAELSTGNLFEACGRLEYVLTELKPHAIKDAFAKRFKTRTELTLAQAYLIYRMRNDYDLYQSLRQYMDQHQIPQPSNSIKDFATNVLDIEESRFKWLLRIADGLSSLTKLKGRVCLTSEGFLEKLSYLRKALDNHSSTPEMVTYALNILPVKQFREFARLWEYDLISNLPITKDIYLKALPFLEQFRSYQKEGKTVTILNLPSKEEQGWLAAINRTLERGEKDFREKFPEIVWNSDLQTEPAEAQIEPETAQIELVEAQSEPTEAQIETVEIEPTEVQTEPEAETQIEPVEVEQEVEVQTERNQPRLNRRQKPRLNWKQKLRVNRKHHR